MLRGQNMSKKQKRTTAPITPPITFVLVFIYTFLLIANARFQARLEAGAQRTLEGVGCSALFGSDCPSTLR
jgi:hypothetical protein